MIRASAIRIPFRYAAGAAGSRFLAALRDESRVLGGRCATCGRVFVPLRSYCATCGSGIHAEIQVGPGGTVQAWTQRADGTVFALVRLDGADGALLHRLVGSHGKPRSGMRVRARFAAERRASILDIAGFEPEQGAGA